MGALGPAGPAEAAPTCFGRRATIVGTGERDVLVGTSRSDVIVGRGGGDVIRGRGGGDFICAGRGGDRIWGGRGPDRISAGRGRDRVSGGPGRDLISGGGGADVLDGHRGVDDLRGGPGHDACFQGPGPGSSTGCVPVIAAAGDIACDPNGPAFNGGAGTRDKCRMLATAALLTRTDPAPAGVLPLGDLQYPDGALEDFLHSYDPSWGQVRAITYPVPGNHEYHTENAAGYYGYFETRAHPPDGYYALEIAGWDLLALNSVCGHVECGEGSPQLVWMRDRLASSSAGCSLAFFHHPRFASDQPTGVHSALRLWWRELHAGGVDVVLNGHDHAYERFRPLTGTGQPSSAGIRQFVVGTGGKNLRSADTIHRHSQVRNEKSFGILEMALLPGGYEWRFVPAAPGTFTDAGSGSCH
jgi:Ca2+-binding RTX toxin-like protein